MRVWTILLSRLLVALLPLMIMKSESAEATQTPQVQKPQKQQKQQAQKPQMQRLQKAKKAPVKQENSPIIGELDQSDTIPTDEDNDDIAVDEEAVPLKSKKGPNAKGITLKNKEKSPKEKAKDKKAAQKRQKLMEGFKKAENFHKMWFNLPDAKLLTSRKNLMKFCKVACTKNQCADEEVANNCHLICPGSTTKQCADPLKKPGNEAPEAEEVVPGDDDMIGGEINPAGAPEAPISSSVDIDSSLEQSDRALADGDGEGG